MKGEFTPSLASSAEAMEHLVRLLPEQFEKAMDDDFNTAAALGVLQRTTRDLNRLIAEVKQDDTAGFPSKLLEEGLTAFMKLGAVLGILTSDPVEYFKQKQDEGMKDVALSEEHILNYIEERKTARAQKNWKRADQIREELLSKGVILEDNAQGTVWKVKTLKFEMPNDLIQSARDCQKPQTQEYVAATRRSDRFGAATVSFVT